MLVPWIKKLFGNHTIDYVAYEALHQPMIETLADRYEPDFALHLESLFRGTDANNASRTEVAQSARQLFHEIIREKAGLAYDPAKRKQAESTLQTHLGRLYGGNIASARVASASLQTTFPLPNAYDECSAMLDSQAEEYMRTRHTTIQGFLKRPVVYGGKKTMDEDPIKGFIKSVIAATLRGVDNSAELAAAKKRADDQIPELMTHDLEGLLHNDVLNYIHSLRPRTQKPPTQKAAISLHQ